MQTDNLSKFIVTTAIASLGLAAMSGPAMADPQISGRLMLDTTIADDRGADLTESEIRRARLGIKGNYGDNLTYKVEFNYDSGNEIELEDGYLEFKTDAGLKIKAGQFKTPNSLDEQTSSRFISTLERSAFTDAFGFSRQLGIALGGGGDHFKFDIGVFGENVNAGTNQEQGVTIAGRVTMNPIKAKGKILHLGASARYRDAGDNNSQFRYRQRPYTRVAASRIIDTGRFADSDIFIGAEAGVILDQFWAAAEYGHLSADGATDPSFSGYYLEAGYFFGGQKGYKSYKFNRPKVDNPVTDGGSGAFSVVARYDVVDLSEVVLLGGQLDTIILGVDWWPTKNTRLGLNYFNADADASGDASGVVARMQFDFQPHSHLF